MAITIQQPGAAKAAAAAGTAIGKGQRAKEDRARAEREQITTTQQVARAAQRADQQKAQQVAMDWELQKMQMRSQQEFEQELRDKQREFDKFNRAKDWDLEKLELRSHIDFEMEEKERTEKIGRAQAKHDQVNKHITEGLIPPREKDWKTDNMLWKLEQEINEIKNPSNLPDPQTREFAESREIRAQESATRTQEAHEARMVGKEPSLVDKRWAIKFLADNPESRWYWFDKAGAGSKETKAGRKLAREILGAEEASIVETTSRTMAETSIPVTAIPIPSTVEEFKLVVSQLKASDPVKAQQYHTQHVERFRK